MTMTEQRISELEDREMAVSRLSKKREKYMLKRKKFNRASGTQVTIPKVLTFMILKNQKVRRNIQNKKKYVKKIYLKKTFHIWWQT